MAQDNQNVQVSVQVLPAPAAKPQGKVLGASYNQPNLSLTWWQKFKSFLLKLF
jgi:hypothetical protein